MVDLTLPGGFTQLQMIYFKVPNSPKTLWEDVTYLGGYSFCISEKESCCSEKQEPSKNVETCRTEPIATSHVGRFNIISIRNQHV